MSLSRNHPTFNLSLMNKSLESYFTFIIILCTTPIYSNIAILASVIHLFVMLIPKINFWQLASLLILFCHWCLLVASIIFIAFTRPPIFSQLNTAKHIDKVHSYRLTSTHWLIYNHGCLKLKPSKWLKHQLLLPR